MMLVWKRSLDSLSLLAATLTKNAFQIQLCNMSLTLFFLLNTCDCFFCTDLYGLRAA